jgi:tight adherence protein B
LIPRRAGRTDHPAKELSAVAMSVSRLVRSGSGLADALDETARTVVPAGSSLRAELLGVTAHVRRGGSIDGGLSRWQGERNDRSVDLLVWACRFGHAQGGDLPAALDGAAVSLLDRAEAADEARALASQARTSAAVLLCLPPVGAASFALLDPSVASTLLTTGAGLACLAGGLTLETAGAWVLSRMVASALR